MSDSIRVGMGMSGSRPGSVSLDGGPPGSAHRGLGGTQAITGAAAIMPGSTIKNVLSQGFGVTAGSNPGGGFNWKSNNGGLEQNEVLAGMLESSGATSKDTIDFFIGKVEEPMIKFIYHMARRETAVFYRNYQTVKDQFIFDRKTGQESPLKKEFIADVNKMHTFHQTVAMQGSIIFGYLLIQELQRSGKESPNETDFNNAVQLACYHILFLEMLNWLFNTKKGVSFTHRLPKELEDTLNNLDAIKEQFSKMWETFETPFPYANLNFVAAISTPVEYARVYDPNNYGEYLGFVPQQSNRANHTSDYNDVMELVYRNAAKYNGYDSSRIAQTTAAKPNISNEVGMTWGTNRNDLHNLTGDNVREFDIPKYFQSIGRENHYWIDEDHWKHIQRVYRRHPEQRQEESLMNNGFRVVILDIHDFNFGWKSVVVRSEKLPVTRKLTDPSVLLPVLERPENDEELYMVIAAPLAEVADEKSLEVPVEKVTKLGKGIPAIVVDEPIVDTKTAAVMGNVDIVSQRTLARFSGPAATVFTELTNWDVYSCVSKEDKTRLYMDAPYLFVDSKLEKASDRPSFYSAAHHLRRMFNEGVIDNNLCNFINGRLTNICNEWLANECGYNVVNGKGGGGKLQIGNLMADFQDLHDELKKSDPAAHGVFTDNTAVNYLTTHLKMFHYVNPYLGEPEEMGALDRIKDEVNLYVIRSFYVVNVKGNKGPYYEEENVPQYIKRSTFPDIFRLMEITVEEEGKENVPEVYRDKLIRFADSNNVWLFSYTLGDRNVATLRHVNAQKELVVMGVN